MSGAERAAGRPDYGLDAPGVVRNLFLAGGTGLLVWATAAAGLWSGEPSGIPLSSIGLACGVSFSATGAWMVYASKVGKLRARERLLDLVSWKGDEAVLDVGCGRGLMLIGAARRLTSGRATGIDIWQAEDLSGNRPEATLENATREGVSDRVGIQTADMRQIPFPDATFDVVVSCWAVHNLYDPKERGQAVREIVRVLKPGGVALIKDIRHGAQYTREFEEGGCPGVRRVDNRLASLLATLVTWGSVRPCTLVVKKPTPREESLPPGASSLVPARGT
jgi:SAM-dependent methyltransferase